MQLLPILLYMMFLLIYFQNWLCLFRNNTALVALIHFNLLLLVHFQLCFCLYVSVSYVVLFYLFHFLLSIQSENVFACPSKWQVSEDTENLISLVLPKLLMKILKLCPFTSRRGAQLNTGCYFLKVHFHISTFPLRLLRAAVSKAFSHLDRPPQFLNTSLEVGGQSWRSYSRCSFTSAE